MKERETLEVGSSGSKFRNDWGLRLKTEGLGNSNSFGVDRSGDESPVVYRGFHSSYVLDQIGVSCKDGGY